MLATSGSPSSIQATVFAAELAAEFNATLRIVHVVAPVQYRLGRLAPMRAVQRKLPDPFESSVLRQARELAWRHGSAATVQLLAGEPPRAIVAAVADAPADLLVIGARNHNGVFGRTTSTRRWIHAHAPCHVLTPTAGSEAARSQLSAGRWLQHY
jgi:nucleotide-binding universal stress UspA family protein